MYTLAPSDTVALSATSATTVNYAFFGDEVGTSDTWKCLASGQCASSAATVYTSPGGGSGTLISAIDLYNTGASYQTVGIYRGGTAASNQIGSLQIPPGGFAHYEQGTGWQVYSVSGLIVGTPIGPGGVGTPATASQSLTASSANVVTGTLLQLATNAFIVGSRYRFRLNLGKTAAGINTWTAVVKFGTAGTNADAAIATFTSGTNTAAIDQAQLDIEMVILTLGGAATASCVAYYVNTLTNATGLGNIAPIPGSTAAFNSAAASPFIHVDVTPGASAVMTAVACLERLA